MQDQKLGKPIILIFAFCALKLALHLVGDYYSGFQGDELLHIQTGHHPALGYMEFPPVIGWLAFIQNQFESTSVFVHHLFPHLASLSILILAAFVTQELGGKEKAIFIVLLCILVAPGFGRSQQLFQPVVFSQFCWLFSFYQLVRFVKNKRDKYLLYLTLGLAFGFLCKFDIVFFIAGLPLLLLFKNIRQTLVRLSTLAFILLFLVLIAPNLWWQHQHQFPVLNMFSRLYETQLDKLTIDEVLTDLIVSMNPLTAVVWIGGLIFMFNARDKVTYQPLAFCIAFSLLVLAASKSKAYYFYPALLTILPFGGVWLEKKVFAPRSWTIYPAVTLLVLSGAILIPFGIALMPLETFIKFAGIKKRDGRYPVEYTEYYSALKWKNTLTNLKIVYDSLPTRERSGCLIWGKHYSQAGAVNLYKKEYELPPSISYHGSFYLWSPNRGPMPETMIAYSNGEAKIEFFKPFFQEVVAVKQVHNPYAADKKNAWETIYICRHPVQDFRALKHAFAERIFE